MDDKGDNDRDHCQAARSPNTGRRVSPGSRRYRWILLGITLPYNIIAGLIFTSSSVLYAEYTLHFQATRAEVGWSVSIHMALLYMTGLLVSGPLKLFGGRPVAFVGGLMLVIGFLLSSMATNIYTLYITQGVITGIGNCLVEWTSYYMIQQHFTEHRALAAGLSSMGFNAGNFIAPVLMQGLVNHFGWRGALIILAGILAHLLPLSLTFRRPEMYQTEALEASEEQPKADGRLTYCNGSRCTYLKMVLVKLFKDASDFSLLKNVSFALFCIGGGFIFRFCHVGFVQHFMTRCIHVGIDRKTASFILSLFAMIATGVRLIIAFVANLKCVSVQVLYILGMSFSCLANIFLVLLPSLYGPIASAVLFGMASGFSTTVFSVILVELNGAHHIARSLGLFGFILGLGVLISTPLMGLIRDLTDSYDVPYYFNAGLGAIGTVICIIMFCIERKKRRMKH